MSTFLETISPTVVLAVSPSVFLLFAAAKLWVRERFRVHRTGGFLFLVQYTLAWYYYLTDYDYYKQSVFVWSLQLNGCVQAISAIYTFKFLPKTKADPGFFGDKGAVTYTFVVENLFYQLMTLAGFIYYNDAFYPWIHNTFLGQCIEAPVIFLVFFLIRPLFPKTHFRDAQVNEEKNRTEKNRSFYQFGTWIVKFFYICSKHYMGFAINYIRFLDGFSPAEMKVLNWMVLANSGTVSIAVFLHTLRFKHVLDGRVTFTMYMILFGTPLLGVLQLGPLLMDHFAVMAVCTVGLFVNFAPKKIFHMYQISVMCLFLAFRHGYLPSWIQL